MSDNLQLLMKPRAKQGDEELEVLNGIRVMCCALIILGNTYFYILRSPLQNLEAIEHWLKSGFFSTVLSADLTVDLFFWISAFLASYQLLVLLKVNGGSYPSSKKALVFSRFMRLAPLYYFTFFFMWKVMALWGGEGPLFFEYSNMAQCKKNWFWHLTFMNNLIPWKRRD
jgi:peptidoglycan/LPS O-acetylase OafA/YrhL